LNSKVEDIFDIRQAGIPVPEHAQIRESIICYNCGEPTMDTRAREHGGVKLCIPCYEEEMKKKQ
jgi:formylmethanofuran dehydrogenase subunit E